ncbi:MAG: putative ABC transporter periplasmic-binding protein [Methanocella sp. PtaU1.Bin125]|nr:MAG: putative ABC transporter periplasmic-binding protein [Methanocella sp. PtaU1.Bin125]
MKINNKTMTITIIMMLLAIVVSFSLCVSPTPTSPASGTPTPAPTAVPATVGGTLKYASAFGPSDSLDPANGYVGWYMREAGVYETLFGYDANMVMQPELATGYEKISDTEWRINLRPDVTFHDGTPLNADAVIFSLNRVLKNNTRSSEYSFIDSIAKYSDSAVTIKTKTAYAPTIASLTDPIMSIISPNIVNVKTTPDGTGPFKFMDYTKAVSLTLARNDRYWNGTVYLDGVVIYYISDPTTRLLKLQSGEVDAAYSIPTTDIAGLQASGNYIVYNKPTLRTYFLYFNMKKSPLDNPLFRQAINYALNKSEVCDTALDGIGGTPATCVFPSIMDWSANDRTGGAGYTYNVARAKELLAQAGFKDTNGDGWLEYNGQPFVLSLKTYTSRPQLKPSAEVIASELNAVGINTKLEAFTSISSDLSSGNYEMALYAWGVAPTGDPDYITTRFFLSTGAEANKTGYKNTQMDSWLNQARKSFDKTERKSLYDQVQIQALNDTPYIPVFYQNAVVATSKNVGGVQLFPNEISFITKDMYLKK